MRGSNSEDPQEIEQVAQFLKKIKRLLYYPDLGVKEWRERYRQDYGVELKKGDLAYRKIAKAIDNARF